MADNKKRPFWYITCKDILTLVCAAAVPVALGIYTAITYQQDQQQVDRARQLNIEQAAALRQDTIYDKFLDNIYNLDKDGHLNDNGTPWAFANAYYRVAHRQLDPAHKGDVLQFLKEKKLIGKYNCSTKCNPNRSDDIIRLDELNFDNVYLRSQTGTLNQLKLDCVVFKQVSMTNATFSSTNLDGASFDQARLDNSNFIDSSLRCASFIGANLRGVHFSNVDLRGAVLTEEQYKQVSFENTILPNGTYIGQITTTTTTATTTTKVTATVTNTTKVTATATNTTSTTTATITTKVTATATNTTATTTTTTTTTTTITTTITTTTTTTTTITTATTAKSSMMTTMITITTEKELFTADQTTTSCPAGYSLAPSGLCINLATDLNNCGAFDHVCSTNYTECVDRKCVKPPTLKLANGTVIFDPDNYLDDRSESISLPLSITLYNYSTSNVTVTTNGVVCLGGCSKAYNNENLPSANFSGPTAFGYWDDLRIRRNTSQNIYYAVAGMTPNRTTTFEFIASHFLNSNEYYHFQIIFFENLPNIVKYVYFEISDEGISATIGVQKYPTGPHVTYSVNQKSVTSNLKLIFDTIMGTVTIE